jgi:hypothetical protein
MRRITTIAFAALLVMGFAATAMADGMCSGSSAHTAQAPSTSQSVAQVPVTQTIRPGG